MNADKGKLTVFFVSALVSFFAGTVFSYFLLVTLRDSVWVSLDTAATSVLGGAVLFFLFTGLASYAERIYPAYRKFAAVSFFACIAILSFFLYKTTKTIN